MDFNIEEADIVERFEEAIRQSRRQQIEIDRLKEETKEETRPLIIEENQRRIEELIQNHLEYDEMTRNSFYERLDRLDKTINDYLLKQVNTKLNERQTRMLERAGEIRKGLLELRMQNGDILYDDGTHRRGKENTEEEKRTQTFLDKIEKLKAKIEEVRKSLILHEEENIRDVVKTLNEEMKGLDEEAKSLISDLDKLKGEVSSDKISATVKNINKKLDELKAAFKELKIKQISNYNSKADAVNKRLENLKSLTGLDEETIKALESLSPIPLCNRKITSYRDTKYLEDLDYDKLIALDKALAEIESKSKLNTEEIELQATINHINDELDKVTTLEDLLVIGTEITEVTTKVNESTTLSEESKNKFLDQIDKLNEKYNKKKEELEKVTTKGDDNKYEMFRTKLWTLMTEINNLDKMLDAHFATSNEESVEEYIKKIEEYGKNLSELEEEIKKAHEAKEINDDQFNNLNKMVKDVREILEQVEKKSKNPVMIKDIDFWAFITGEIAGLSRAVDKLEETIDNLEKPIKDKETRKKIDKAIATIEKEIKFNRAYLEQHKDENEEKYNETVAKLDELENRLDKVSKKYRQKCPFLVRTAKSAKAFYKKHPKLVLLAAGLATVAILHATVGPIIIPAIIHGNLMIGNKVTFLRPLLKGINNALGGLINAKIVNNRWMLANGTIIYPSCASASLLKGLAISGMGTAALVAPVIAGIKKLTEKMNLKNLKSKAKEKYHDVKEKVKDKVQAIKDKREKRKEEPEEEIIDIKTKDTKKNKNSIDKEKLKEISKLLKEYQKSGLTFGDFVEQNNLSEVDAEILRAFIPREEEETKGASR
jgi:DNA repair exonuclease SbcCD ATPase subunit